MKHLKLYENFEKINELNSMEFKNQVREICDGTLAYLYDEGFGTHIAYENQHITGPGRYIHKVLGNPDPLLVVIRKSDSSNFEYDTIVDTITTLYYRLSKISNITKIKLTESKLYKDSYKKNLEKVVKSDLGKISHITFFLI
jgi:hypothetical protein